MAESQGEDRHFAPPEAIREVNIVEERYWGALPVRSISLLLTDAWTIVVELTSGYLDLYYLKRADKDLLEATAVRYRSRLLAVPDEAEGNAKLPFDPLQKYEDVDDEATKERKDTWMKTSMDGKLPTGIPGLGGLVAAFSAKPFSAKPQKPGRDASFEINANFVHGVILNSARGLGKWTFAEKGRGSIEWCVCVLDELESKGGVEVGSTMSFVRYIRAKNNQIAAYSESSRRSKASVDRIAQLVLPADFDRFCRDHDVKNYVGHKSLKNLELTGRK